MEMKTFNVVVHADATNEWIYEVEAEDEQAAVSMIERRIENGEDLPDPVEFNCGVERPGAPLEIVDSFEA
jgi:hypothetical protein